MILLAQTETIPFDEQEFDHHHSPVPEPSFVGVVMIGLVLLLVLWASWRRDK